MGLIREEWWHGCMAGRAVQLTYPSIRPCMLLRESDEDPPITWQVQTVVTKKGVDKNVDSRVLLDLKWGNTLTGFGGLLATIDAGQTVTLCGSVLEMAARTVGEGAGEADLRIMVSEGYKANPLPVTFTDEPRFTDPFGAAGLWAVPPFATRMSLLSSDPLPPAVPVVGTLTWQTDNSPVGANVIAQQSFAPWTAPNGGGSCDVPRGAQAVAFLYTDNVGNPIAGVRIQPVWLLAI